MLVHLKKIIKKAKEGGYGLCAFNTSNLETTLGIVSGAKENFSPIIIQVTESTIEYAGLDPITEIIKSLIKAKIPKIPVALHLDHGKNFRAVVECIKAGFSSVMIDASFLPFKENVTITRKVVDYAHRRGVFVQGEIGRIVKGKKEVKKLAIRPEEFLTDPAEAVEFVKKTKVDTLAVAIGNVHGVYKMLYGVPKLNLTRLKEISQKIKIPLVLHGASGIPEKEIGQAIKLGVTIINIDTEIRMAFVNTLKKTLESKEEYDPRKILRPSIEAVKKVVGEKIKLVGSRNKA